MADILIRGMEIPKDGRKHTVLLQFLEDGKCRGIVEYSKSYDDRSVKVFEVSPLPEGHGRLIDADRLTKRLNNFVEWCRDDRRPGAFFVMDCPLPDSPTIVPAEGGTDDGDE